MELTVVVHREPDGYWSEIPELPGCFASGATLEELHEALGESIGLYVADAPARLAGRPLVVGESLVSVELTEPPR